MDRQQFDVTKEAEVTTAETEIVTYLSEHQLALIGGGIGDTVL